MAERDVAVAREAIEAYGRGGVEAALAHMHPEIEWTGPSDWLEDSVYIGHDGVRRLSVQWTGSFDEFELVFERAIDAGDHVLILLNQLMGIRGSSSRLEQRVAWDMWMQDGKITRVHTYFTWEEALRDTGLEG